MFAARRDFTLEGSHLNYVTGVDPCIQFNGARHNTYRYDHMKRIQNPYLVIRRGDEFKLNLRLSQVYDRDRDAITFNFRCKGQSAPSYGHTTLVSVNLTEHLGSVYSWGAALEGVFENTIAVRIRPPPKCIVGIWYLEIDIKTIDRHTFRWANPIYILFNPWCKDDEVYLESEEWRQESVLSSDGLIWRGSPNTPSMWKYAQFERDILDCALYLMVVVGRLSGVSRSKAVSVSRALSAAVNANDDQGAVVGSWANDFPDGESPMYWTGSMEILQQYYTTKHSVKYGQCWVFAGVLTSVCRALGLPARSVTNFSSAHDQNGTMTIDYVFDPRGQKIQEFDSVWNFHVWTEVWMKRADLGVAYDGWQVIDATPQEESEGMFKHGPSSVAACKRGDVLKPFDGPFLYAEVNADIIYWQYDITKDEWLLIKKDTAVVGKNISTKAPGVLARLDLTDNYKFKEGSNEERAANLKALSMIESFPIEPLKEIFADIVFKFEYLEDVLIGQNFTVNLDMTNRNLTKDHVVKAVLRVDVVHYTGKFLASVKWYSHDVIVQKGQTSRIYLNVSYEDYQKLYQDNCIFVISCLAQINGTTYQHFDRDEFRLKMPKVEIETNDVAPKGVPLAAIVKLTNPLPTFMNNGIFLIDAPGLDRQLRIDVNNVVGPGETVVREFTFIPNEPGKHVIAAKFMSTQLHDANGFHEFLVNN